MTCRQFSTGAARDAGEMEFSEFLPRCELMSKNSLKLSACGHFIAIPAGRELIFAVNSAGGPDPASVLTKTVER